MLRPFIPELVMSTDLLSFEHSSVLLFALDREKDRERKEASRELKDIEAVTLEREKDMEHQVSLQTVKL